MGTGIVVIGATFVDIKGYPFTQYIPAGRNSGRVAEVHGGVSRNIAEDIANVELRPTFVSVVDEGGLGTDVVAKLARHRCNTNYIASTPGGMGTWLAIFDHTGDLVSSISRRPDLSAIMRTLDESGDEIFSQADSIAVEFDIEVPILKRILDLAERHGKEVYSPVSNMTIASERRDLLKRVSCLVCNQQEAGILFSEDYEQLSPQEMQQVLVRKIEQAKIPRMVVTMGSQGSVYAERGGESGICAPQKVDVVDTTGAGDAFFAGVAIGLTYGKTLAEACVIGTRLASSVIINEENVCPRFLPAEFGIDKPETPEE
jgi:pseudouridine kinase